MRRRLRLLDLPRLYRRGVAGEGWRAFADGEDMLDFAYGVQPGSRLSCQIKVVEEFEGLTVRTPERQA